jgi:hypothetical protein
MFFSVILSSAFSNKFWQNKVIIVIKPLNLDPDPEFQVVFDDQNTAEKINLFYQKL